jgi:hypothetical protein
LKKDELRDLKSPDGDKAERVSVLSFLIASVTLIMNWAMRLTEEGNLAKEILRGSRAPVAVCVSDGRSLILFLITFTPPTCFIDSLDVRIYKMINRINRKRLVEELESGKSF